MAWYGSYGGWAPYVPVAQRRAKAVKHAAQIAKREKRPVAPVQIDGKKLTKSFWGQAWCDNLERYSDFANRLPRGRTYVRNGSVVDLQIDRGRVRAIVAGSEVYKVTISISTLDAKAWKRIKQDCSQSIDSLLDLLQGKFDQPVMQRLTHRETGLFPAPREIKMACSCPDSAGMCKHLAAVMYGVGARLDSAPEMLFVLRDVDHLELISQAAEAENLEQSLAGGSAGSLAGNDLGELFGIELAGSANAAPVDAVQPSKPSKGRSRKRLDTAQAKATAQSAAIVQQPKAAGRKPSPVAKKNAAGRSPRQRIRGSTNRSTMPAATRKKVPQRANRKRQDRG